MHESLDEFKIWPDQTPGFDSNRYDYNCKNGVTTFSRLFFIRSYSCLQIMMICTRTSRKSKFGKIRPQTAELAALECLKKIPKDL